MMITRTTLKYIIDLYKIRTMQHAWAAYIEEDSLSNRRAILWRVYTNLRDGLEPHNDKIRPIISMPPNYKKIRT